MKLTIEMQWSPWNPCPHRYHSQFFIFFFTAFSLVTPSTDERIPDHSETSSGDISHPWIKRSPSRFYQSSEMKSSQDQPKTLEIEDQIKRNPSLL